MTQDDVNAMEELARASMTIPDLSEGIAGTVFLYGRVDGVTDREVVDELLAGQLALALAGWKRVPDKEPLLNGTHVYEKHVYRKRFPGEKKSRFISGWVTSFMGVMATFTSTQQPGEFVQGIPNDPYGMF